MQSTSVGSSGGGGGGGGQLSRSGLSRIRSAPATWLEALLEEDEEESLKPNLGLTELLTGNSSDTPTSRGSFEFPIPVDQGLYQQGGEFHRQNSSPADFLSGSDGFIPNFGIPANYEYLSPNIDVSPGSKRSREMEALFSSPEFTSQMVKASLLLIIWVNRNYFLIRVFIYQKQYEIN